MAANSPIMQEDISRLCEEYETPYHAIVREHIVMGVPRYFLERWVPVLGVAPATVINTLRQLNFHTPEQAIVISGEALARESAMSRRHLYTCLESNWLAAFVTVEQGHRARTPSGKVLQEANKYHIRMDDPLSPADAYSLMLHLQRMGPTPIEAAQQALTHQPRELWATSLDLPSQYFITPEPITANIVLQRAFPDWHPANTADQNAFDQIAQVLHHHMVLGRPDGRVSKIIVPQYFRTRWWNYLGHDLAWSYLWLRGAVYENPEEGIARYNCWIPSLETLLGLINRPREWWRRNVEHPKLRNREGGSADFFHQVASQKGRDPAAPQWVARQFRVRIEIPIAPSDRALYSELLIDWPEQSPNTARPNMHSSSEPGESLRHIQTHWEIQGPSHLNTQKNPPSATSEHTEPPRVCHIQTHGFATFEHRDSESFKAHLNTSPLIRTKHSATGLPVPAADFKMSSLEVEKNNLIAQLATALKKTPEQPLHHVVAMTVWLQHAWSEAVTPYTPAWVALVEGRITSRDLLALMLAVSADRSIEHPPRYLSWLVQQWLANPNNPPVIHWEQWQQLADVSLEQWTTTGRQAWIELTPSDNRDLPFGLETLFQVETSDSSSTNTGAIPVISGDSVSHNDQDLGLGALVANGEITIKDVWRAALSQLSLKLHRSIYHNWIEGTLPVSYENGILTLRARHFMAREQLTRRYNGVVEDTVSDLAKEKITIRYVL